MDEFKVKHSGSNGDVFKFREVGDQLVGVYLGSREHSGEYGPTKKHLFSTESGGKVVFGQKILMDELTSAEVGHRLRITYTGLQKKMKLFEIAVGKKVLDDVETQVALEAATDGFNDDALEEEEEVRTAAARPAPRATAPSTAKVNKVADLLASRKNA